MGAARYTTPEITLEFSDTALDLTQADSVYVTFRGEKSLITKTGDALTVAAKKITLRLEQEETAQLGAHVMVQANWMVGNNRFSSDVAGVEFSMQLLKEVIA